MSNGSFVKSREENKINMNDGNSDKYNRNPFSNQLYNITSNDMNSNTDLYEIYSIRSIHKRGRHDSWALVESPCKQSPNQNGTFSMVLH